MNTQRLIIILLAIIAMFSCVDPYEENITPAYDEFPIATLMANDTTDTYSQWVRILKNTDLFNTMNLDADYTCFVPNNAGIATYLAKNGWTSVDEIPLEDATYLVKYHTIPGAIYEQSSFDNGVIADTTATGDQLSIEIRTGGINAIYVNGEARINTLDVSATNGVIHVLDDVLTPVTETIWEKISDGSYSIMAEAVSATGYSDMLNTVYSTSKTSDGTSVQVKKSYTLFAVSDAIFAQNSINSLSDLCNKLGAGSDYTSESNLLNQYIAYHILDQQLDYTALSTFPDGESSQNIQTMAANKLINLSLSSEELVINSDVRFVSYNTSTKNGLLHSVDGLMVVKTPPQVTVEWELTDYSDLASLMTNYRSTLETSTSITWVAEGTVSSITWSAIPDDNNDYAIGYLVRGKSDNTYAGLINYDAICLYLGIYGWAQFTSPTIIAGTYNVEIYYLSRASSTQSGKLTASIDGNSIGSEFTTHGYSTLTTEVRSTSLGQVTFSETTTHTLKLLSTDNSVEYIDYIKLEPVN